MYSLLLFLFVVNAVLPVNSAFDNRPIEIARTKNAVVRPIVNLCRNEAVSLVPKADEADPPIPPKALDKPPLPFLSDCIKIAHINKTALTTNKKSNKLYI